MKSVSFTPAGLRGWRKLAPDIRQRLDQRLTEFASTGVGDVKRLKGRDGARLRVGDWRIIFYEDGDALVVVAAGHRREIYE